MSRGLAMSGSLAPSRSAVLQVLEQDMGALAAHVAQLPFEESRGEVTALEKANRGLPRSSRSTAPRDHA